MHPPIQVPIIGRAISVHTIKAKCIHTNKAIHAENRYCVHYELWSDCYGRRNRGYLCSNSKPEVYCMGLCVCVRYASKLPLFYNQLGLNRMPLMLTTTSGVKRMNTYILNTLNMRRGFKWKGKIEGTNTRQYIIIRIYSSSECILAR